MQPLWQAPLSNSLRLRSSLRAESTASLRRTGETGGKGVQIQLRIAMPDVRLGLESILNRTPPKMDIAV